MTTRQFREKPKPANQLAAVVAVQWTGQNTEEVEEFTRGEFDKELDPTGERLAFIIIHTNHGSKKVGVGDWIVRKDGMLEPMSGAEFAENFALDEGEGKEGVEGKGASVTRLPVKHEPLDPPPVLGMPEPLPESVPPTTAAGQTFEGATTAPYPAPEPGASWGTDDAEDYPDHMIGPDPVMRDGSVVGRVYTCSCGWVATVGSEDLFLARIPAQDHVSAVSMGSAKTLPDVVPAPSTPPTTPVPTTTPPKGNSGK